MARTSVKLQLVSGGDEHYRDLYFGHEHSGDLYSGHEYSGDLYLPVDKQRDPGGPLPVDKRGHAGGPLSVDKQRDPGGPLPSDKQGHAGDPYPDRPGRKPVVDGRGSERVPYLATLGATLYEGIKPVPVAILLDNVRSLYNVGAFFRTADAAGCEKLHLCGITGRPPERAIAKTALGAEETVAWEHHEDACEVARSLRAASYEIAAVETSIHAVDLFDWQPAFPLCIVFGHEVDGLRPELLDLCDTHVRIPMLGRKHSLNVATAGGVVIYELLRKYRRLSENARINR